MPNEYKEFNPVWVVVITLIVGAAVGCAIGFFHQRNVRAGTDYDTKLYKAWVKVTGRDDVTRDEFLILKSNGWVTIPVTRQEQ